MYTCPANLSPGKVIDQLAFSFYSSFDLPVTIIRPFNTYGPRQSARAVIPTIITQLASGSKSIKLGATHPTRDFNHVTDTASGFLAALRSENGVGEVINLGSNYEISIGETADMIAELMGVKMEVLTEEQRLRPEKSEVERLWADNTKAENLLNWSPEYGGQEGLRRGLKETIDWFVQPENLSAYRVGQYTL